MTDFRRKLGLLLGAGNTYKNSSTRDFLTLSDE